MAVLKYMSMATTVSVFAALASIIYQAVVSLQQLKRKTTILTYLLALENVVQQEVRPKVAIGYGACTDLLVVNVSGFLRYPDSFGDSFLADFVVDDVNDEEELLKGFGYYFKNGAAAERFTPDTQFFKRLIARAKNEHKDEIKWEIGGNAPMMGIRFYKEGAEVLLVAKMSTKLRKLIPPEIKIAGELIEEDDIHLILEYKSSEKLGPFTAPRANRYILHNDQQNPHLSSLETFHLALKDFNPRLLVVSGLQMMDSYKYDNNDIRDARLKKIKTEIESQPKSTLVHFEMASYVELDFLEQLTHNIFPFVDSMGMNEQELDNLQHFLQFKTLKFASDSNPRVATTLDQMRKTFRLLGERGEIRNRTLSRIHVHTLAYQAFLIVKNSQWKNTKIAASKAALTAHRHVCETSYVNPESALLILDESFATSANDKNDKATSNETPKRVKLNPIDPVSCWDEIIDNIDVEICVAPVLVCRVAKKTAGAGDNISASGLFYQI